MLGSLVFDSFSKKVLMKTEVTRICIIGVKERKEMALEAEVNSP